MYCRGSIPNLGGKWKTRVNTAHQFILTRALVASKVRVCLFWPANAVQTSAVSEKSISCFLSAELALEEICRSESDDADDAAADSLS